MIKYIVPLLFLGTRLAAQGTLPIEDAIRSAWTRQSGLQAGEAMLEKARAEAEARKALRLPTFTAAAGITRTDEPMMAFGTKLNQARIAQADFLPASLNHPDPITGAGASLSVTQPLYAGGRLDAAGRAGADLAGAEAASQAHRRQQVALAVVQAYFGSEVAEQGVRFAEDTLRQARETERFVQSRVDQGLMLKSEADRTRAFRAQSEAGVMEAQQRLASARSALALLMGQDAVDAGLATSLTGTGQEPPDQPGSRSDLEAARLQAEAAQEGLIAQQGTLKPEVGLTLTAGTARRTWGEGGTWTTASIGAKWTFSFAEQKQVQAARAAARAADLDLQWQKAQAGREVEEARRAVATALARMASAKVAVEASESVRAIR
ncbi:MAG TPA: TolC family protein, partial [Holophaga sp.]|nr:TolC family protein [Holophaga sp.]